MRAERRMALIPVASLLCVLMLFSSDSAAQIDPLAPPRPPPQYPCYYCDSVFQSQSALESHINDYHSFQCPNCSIVFRSQSAIDSHIASEHALPPGMEFVTIPRGSFMMGSPGSEEGRWNNENHLRRVFIESFELMTTEVTQAMWEEVMGRNPSHFRGSPNLPVENVSWNDCQDFIAVLNELDSRYTYRLPTEAEWEYAVRAETVTRFYWGNDLSEREIANHAWYTGNSGQSTHPVAIKEPNSWGLHDMSGNVFEWCEDVYTSSYTNCSDDGSAYSGTGEYRVVRGGGWSSLACYCRSALRDFRDPFYSHSDLGFRVVRTGNTPAALQYCSEPLNSQRNVLMNRRCVLLSSPGSSYGNSSVSRVFASLLKGGNS